MAMPGRVCVTRADAYALGASREEDAGRSHRCPTHRTTTRELRGGASAHVSATPDRSCRD
eukprot:2644231-Rhodomonas_salina.4